MNINSISSPCQKSDGPCQKTIQIMFASLLTTIFFIEPSIAENILYGTIRSDKWESHNYRHSGKDEESCSHFPVQLYDFYPVRAYDLKYDDHVPSQDRVHDLGVFVLQPNADLSLMSFDKITGVSKFILKLTRGDWLEYTGRSDGALVERGGTPLKGGGSLKLVNGENPEFIIEGRVEIINGKSHWISFNRNPYFDINIGTFFNCKNEVSLIRLQDFPVIVST